MKKKKPERPPPRPAWMDYAEAGNYGDKDESDNKKASEPSSPAETERPLEQSGLEQSPFVDSLASAAASALSMSGPGQLMKALADAKGIEGAVTGFGKGYTLGLAPALQALLQEGDTGINRQQNVARQERAMAQAPAQATMGELAGSFLSPVSMLAGPAIGAVSKLPALAAAAKNSPQIAKALQVILEGGVQGFASGLGEGLSKTGEVSEGIVQGAKEGGIASLFSALFPAAGASSKAISKGMAGPIDNALLRRLGANKAFFNKLGKGGGIDSKELVDEVINKNIMGKYGLAERPEMGEKIARLAEEGEDALSGALKAVPGKVDPKSFVADMRRQATMAGQREKGVEYQPFIDELRKVADRVEQGAFNYKAPKIREAGKLARQATKEQMEGFAQRKEKEFAEYLAEMRREAFKRAPKGEKVAQREMADTLARESFETMTAQEQKELVKRLAAEAAEAEKQASLLNLYEANEVLKRPLTASKLKADASSATPGTALRAGEAGYNISRDKILNIAEKNAGPEAAQAIREANRAKARALKLGEAAWEGRLRSSGNKDFGLTEQNLTSAISAASGNLAAVPGGALAAMLARYAAGPGTLAAAKATRAIAGGFGSKFSPAAAATMSRSVNPLLDYLGPSPLGYSSIPESELSEEEKDALKRIRKAQSEQQ